MNDKQNATVTTRSVDTSQIRVGDVVLAYGMRVRIDEVREYDSSAINGPAWHCPGTVLNLDEVLAAECVPPAFLRTERWEDGQGWVTGRRDYWVIQGNRLARWRVEVRETPSRASGLASAAAEGTLSLSTEPGSVVCIDGLTLITRCGHSFGTCHTNKCFREDS